MAYQFRSQRKRRPAVELFTFAMVWTILIFFSVIVDMLLWKQLIDQRAAVLLTLVTGAAFLAAILAFLLERLLFRRLVLTGRFCAILMLLAIGTGGASCLAVALYNLPFFTDDIAKTPPSRAARDFFFFTMANTYSFIVTSPRLFLPLGVISLFVTSAFYCGLSIPRRRNDV